MGLDWGSIQTHTYTYLQCCNRGMSVFNAWDSNVFLESVVGGTTFWILLLVYELVRRGLPIPRLDCSGIVLIVFDWSCWLLMNWLMFMVLFVGRRL